MIVVAGLAILLTGCTATPAGPGPATAASPSASVPKAGLPASSPTPVLPTASGAVDPPATLSSIGHRLFGLSEEGEDLKDQQLIAQSVGKKLDVVNIYKAWVWNSALPTTQLAQIAAIGAIPEITWEPWDPRSGVSQTTYSLSKIAAGRFDSYVSNWAREAATYDRPILLRFGHEMNGNWYPWSVTFQASGPAQYVAAYNHVRNLFVRAGASKVEFVWSPNVLTPAGAAPIEDSFPGRDSVDVIAVDGYNFGTSPGTKGGWLTPQKLFGPTLALLAQLAPGTRTIINETSSSDDGGDKAAWISSLLSYLKSTNVTGLIWFDLRSTSGADWSLSTNAQDRIAAQSALASW